MLAHSGQFVNLGDNMMVIYLFVLEAHVGQSPLFN
jgi:hypothetical protein